MSDVWFPVFAGASIASIALASIVYRRANQRSIFARTPANCLFEENGTLGCELGSVRQIVGVRGPVKVCVTRDALHVMPCFPFSLMFQPEIWGLDHMVPLRQIESVEQQSGILGESVVVGFRNGKRLQLRLKDTGAFARAVEQGGGPISAG